MTDRNESPEPAAADDATASPAVEDLLRPMRFARAMTLRLLEIPVDRLLHRPTPSANHALWIAGHLAYVDDWMHAALAGIEADLDDEWVACFGTGSEPSTDADPGPALKEILAVMAARRARLEAWLASLDADALARPLPDGWEAYGRSLADVPAIVAWHEGIHAGQLTVIRNDAGLAPVME